MATNRSTVFIGLGWGIGFFWPHFTFCSNRDRKLPDLVQGLPCVVWGFDGEIHDGEIHLFPDTDAGSVYSCGGRCVLLAATRRERSNEANRAGSGGGMSDGGGDGLRGGPDGPQKAVTNAAGWKGYELTVAFDDVTKLQLSMDRKAVGGGEGEDEEEKPSPMTIEFRKGPTAAVSFRVEPPAKPAEGATDAVPAQVPDEQ